MSADLYTSEIDSEKHGDLFLEMIVDGTLRIVTVDYHESTSFSLPPSSEGWKEAENLIGALQEWVRHTKELDGRMLYGIAYTVDGSPTGKIASWNPTTWNNLSDALEGCEADGWRGYVCQYPSGYRPVGGWENA